MDKPEAITLKGKAQCWGEGMLLQLLRVCVLQRLGAKPTILKPRLYDRWAPMSDSKGKGPQPPPANPEPSEQKRTGRVSFDDRGNSVWEWQLETGVYSRDV